MNYSKELVKIAKSIEASNKKVSDFNKFDYDAFLGYIRQELEKNNYTKDVSRFYVDKNELDVIYDEHSTKVTFRFQIFEEELQISVYDGSQLKNVDKGSIYNDIDRVVKFIVHTLRNWN